MSTILDSYPEYASTSLLDRLRATEYAHLDQQGHIYLDYTGSGLAARCQHAAHQERLSQATFGNPHSVNPTSLSSTTLVDKTRRRVLEFLNASPDEYTVIFAANATGAARLVAEAYQFRRSARFVQTADNHNSINGFREYARRAGSRTVIIPVRGPDLRVDTASVAKALASAAARLRPGCRPRRPAGLFAYPAQSNFSGVQHPLEWVDLAQKQGYDVLLDTAAYLPTNSLDLSRGPRPEFLIASWYKLFGFPTGVGCLVARRDALARLRRPWFSGGTVQAVTVGVPWHAMVEGEGAFEDGTVNFLSIPDVHFGLDWLSSIGMDVIHTRVACLTGWFLRRLQGLRHSDSGGDSDSDSAGGRRPGRPRHRRPMAVIYGPTDTHSRGGTVCFNLVDASGNLVDERIVAAESAAAGISLRTGCFCNPGAGEAAFDVKVPASLPLQLVLRRLSPDDVINAVVPAVRAVRVSFGLASTAADVDAFISFVENTYRDRVTFAKSLPPRDSC